MATMGIGAARRRPLPQPSGRIHLTDAGREPSLIHADGLELQDFATIALLDSDEGRVALTAYFERYVGIAVRHGAGVVLETPTWRASADWGARLGYAPAELAEANREAVRLLEVLRGEYETERAPVVVSGCLGPRGDGYVPGAVMSEGEVEDYHREQAEVFADSAADMLCAITMNYAEEAVGVARAARRAGMPVAISFTVETDGNLPTGMTLREAVGMVDGGTSSYPCYYMINCAHPTHFAHVLSEGGQWLERVRGLRANASRKSHAELNDSPELDVGDPAELGRQYEELCRRLPRLNVMGGCCGTDHRHVEQMAEACSPLFRDRR